MKKNSWLIHPLALLSLTVPSLAATTLVTPTGIAYTTVPNQEATGLFLDDESNIINGVGLSATPTLANYSAITHAGVSLASPGNAWATVDTGPGAGDFFADGGIAPVFTLSLDQVYSLDSIVFWGYHFGANNGNHPQSVRLEFSTNGGSSYGTPFEVTVGFPATFNLAATSTFTAADANSVRMTVTDNQFGTGPNGGDRVGIAEMRFLGTPVPEPSSFILGGLGLLALSRRRRA